MSIAEMKIEAINKITTINNESVLMDVLGLLEEANGKNKTSFNLSRNYEAIKEQYSDVLQKLAQ